MIDLLDTEAVACYNLAVKIQRRFFGRTWRNAKGEPDPRLFDKLANEMNIETAERYGAIGIIAHMNCDPMWEGFPPQVVIDGRLDAHPEGFDHEHQEWQVKKAVATGQEYYGEQAIDAS